MVAGMPPKMRVGGALTEMGFSRVTSADTLDILLGIMPQALRDRFEERGECVFSFALPEGGRCRANVYKQKGRGGPECGGAGDTGAFDGA